MTEEGSHEPLTALKEDHLNTEQGIEIFLVLRSFVSSNGLLQIVVQVLVRVEFGTVGGQEDQLDSVLVFFEPLLDGFAVVDAEVIDDQEDLLLAELDHLPQELQENVRVDRFLQRHPLHLALFVYSTDQTRMVAFGTLAHYRCLAFGREASSVVTFGFDCRFVGKPDLRFLLLCPFLKFRILLLLPLAHLFGGLLIGLFYRSLWGKTPARQHAAHSGQFVTHTEAQLDQVSHCLTAPKSEAELQLIGSLVHDLLLNPSLLFDRKLALVPITPPAPLLAQGFPASGLIAFPPFVHGGRIHAKFLRHQHLCLSRFQSSNRLAALLLLCLLAECSTVSIFHA